MTFLLFAADEWFDKNKGWLMPSTNPNGSIVCPCVFRRRSAGCTDSMFALPAASIRIKTTDASSVDGLLSNRLSTAWIVPRDQGSQQ